MSIVFYEGQRGTPYSEIKTKRRVDLKITGAHDRLADSPLGDSLLEHHRTRMLDITGRGEQYETPTGSQLPQLRNRRRTRLTVELRLVSADELGETALVMAIPTTQLGARGDVPEPFI